MDKKVVRLRRAKRTRSHIRKLHVNRLCVHRTPKHIYAQVLTPSGEVLVYVSTLDKVVKTEVNYGGNVDAAKYVGKIIAERCQQANITEIAFDRSGFKYHGRIKAFADAARESGLSI
jgi:large subunit ribosomal protein L18